MRTRATRPWLANLAIATHFAIVLPAGAQNPAPAAIRVVSGVTTDSAGHPLAHATLWIGAAPRGVSNDSGGFRLTIPGKAVTLDVRRLGYRPAQAPLPAGGDTVLTIALAPIATRLTAVQVTAPPTRSLELHGFYERMADHDKWGGSGQFVTPEEIEWRRVGRVTQLLENRHGIVVRRVGDCTVTSRCWVALGPTDCIMTVYLNGQRQLPEGGAGLQGFVPSNATPTPKSVPWMDDVVSTNEIAGIEIYQRAVQAPPQYQMLNGTCGVILIWTK